MTSWNVVCNASEDLVEGREEADGPCAIHIGLQNDKINHASS